MTSEDRPPLPAMPPPSSEPPAPVDSLPPAPTPTSGPLVDSVPGAAPQPPSGNGPGGLILPSDLPTWAPAPVEQTFDAGDTIPVSSFLAQQQQQAAAAAEPVAAPAEPEWAADTQRGWPTATPGAPMSPSSEFAAPTAFMPPAGITPPPPPGYGAPAAPGSPPPGGGHGSGSGSASGSGSGGKGKLAALVGGIVVLVVLLAGGGYALFHSSAKKTPVAAPAPTAAVPAPASSAPADPTPAVAPTAAAPSPSPTVDPNLAGAQAKMLQSTVIAPLKNLINDDLHVANASDHCVGLAFNAKQYDTHVKERGNLLAQLRKLDVTAMQDAMTWKGLLEQVQIKNIMFEQQLSAYSKDLEKSCSPSTAEKNTHYKQALTLAAASGALQDKFLASYNPVAKLYNIPMQGKGNL